MVPYGVHFVTILACWTSTKASNTDFHTQGKAQAQHQGSEKEAILLRRSRSSSSPSVLLQKRKEPPPVFSFPGGEDEEEEEEEEDDAFEATTTLPNVMQVTLGPIKEPPTTPAPQELTVTMPELPDMDKEAPADHGVKVLEARDEPPVPPEPDFRRPIDQSTVYADPSFRLKQALTSLQWLEDDLRKKYDNMDEKVYTEKIEREEAKVAAETSLGTAKMLGKMRKDMHKFAAPFYRKALLEEIREVVGRKEAVLAKLEGREPQSQPINTTAAPVLEPEEDEDGKLKFLIVPILATAVALIILLFCCFSRRRRRPEDALMSPRPEPLLQRGAMHGPGAGAAFSSGQ